MKKILILCIISISVFSAHGQLSVIKLQSSALVENALDGSVVVVRQSYRVKDKKTGKPYGQNGRAYFGHTYSIGVKTSSGLILTDAALKPWLHDPAYKKVMDAYDPVVSLTEIRVVRNNENPDYVQCPLRIHGTQPDGLWIADTDSTSSSDMEIDVTSGKKEGWIIWYVAKQDLEQSPLSNISLQISNKVYDVKFGEDQDVDNPIGGNKIIGGLYVCPYYSGGGHINFRLVGMMVRDDNKWKLHTPFVDMNIDQPLSASEDDVDNPSDESEDELNLTPIDDSKKKSKKYRH